nr:hypothetical protein CFP56_09002 [Quercus suber]
MYACRLETVVGCADVVGGDSFRKLYARMGSVAEDWWPLSTEAAGIDSIVVSISEWCRFRCKRIHRPVPARNWADLVFLSKVVLVPCISVHRDPGCHYSNLITNHYAYSAGCHSVKHSTAATSTDGSIHFSAHGSPLVYSCCLTSVPKRLGSDQQRTGLSSFTAGRLRDKKRSSKKSISCFAPLHPSGSATPKTLFEARFLRTWSAVLIIEALPSMQLKSAKPNRSRSWFAWSILCGVNC